MTAEPPVLHVVEVVNVITFALGWLALGAAVYLCFLARRWMDLDRDAARYAKLWAKCARAMRDDAKERERAALAVRTDLEKRFGIKTITWPSEKGPN